MCSRTSLYFWRAATVLAALLWVISAPYQAAFGQAAPSEQGEAELWAANFLAADEDTIPAVSWSASDGATLLTLTRSTRTDGLSPAEQTLLRRLVLSSADAPAEAFSDSLSSERARLMFQIGEAAAAAQLLPTLKTSPAGLEVEEVAADLQLAIGQSEAACIDNARAESEGAFWATLRAVCFALDDNYEEAELAMELASAQGDRDGWLRRAIYAASGAIDAKPEARFDSGLTLAMSIKAGLEPSVQTIANSRLDLAAAIARQDTFGPAMRVQVAGIAAEAGLLDGAAHRAVYEALLATEGFSPRTALEVALSTTLGPSQDTGARARSVRAALQTARGNAARFSAVSRLLLDDLTAIPIAEGNRRMALDFAVATLAAGDHDASQEWADLGRQVDPFHAAWIEGLIMLVAEQGDHDQLSDGLTRLIDEAKSTSQKTQVKRFLTLCRATGRPLSPGARAFLAEAIAEPSSNARVIDPDLLTSIAAAGEAGAGAEVILRILSITQGGTDRLSSSDAGVLVGALSVLGEEAAARALALEATGYFKTSF